MSRKKREDIETNLTPLIDLVFLLLIFFIVSSVFRTENNKLVLNLPESSSGETTKENDNLLLEVHENKIFFKDREYLDLKELEQAINKEDKNSQIELKGDKNSSYGRIIEIFDILHKNNFTSINLITTKKELE